MVSLLIFLSFSSEANDLALQIAERVTGSTEIIVLQGYVNCAMFCDMIRFFFLVRLFIHSCVTTT